MKKNKKEIWKNFWLVMTAFGGLGLECVYAYGLEPWIYGAPMQEWKNGQIITHWIVTCVTWLLVAVWIWRDAKKTTGFDLLEKGETMRLWQWCGVVFCVVLAVTLNYMDWGGFKVLVEFQHKGTLLFTFQYLYYAVETVLFMLIIVFGQRLCEALFHNRKIPYGGLICGLTWGLAHTFTKGSVAVGLGGMLYGFLFGTAYLLVGRDIKKTWVLLYLMFAF